MVVGRKGREQKVNLPREVKKKRKEQEIYAVPGRAFSWRGQTRFY